ncbi:hypothetical protein Tco_0878254 [Tanacetum coccineum]|uniref:Uncharacterized protein n=1 Tax=Tanacetum coccineum TaxID=301880 RepID=A0ABQ5C0T4_9ASTR
MVSSFWHLQRLKENGVIRTKKYAELSAVEKIQADCDMKATNIIIQGLPADIYSLVNHHRVAKDFMGKSSIILDARLINDNETLYKMKMSNIKLIQSKHFHLNGVLIISQLKAAATQLSMTESPIVRPFAVHKFITPWR